VSRDLRELESSSPLHDLWQLLFHPRTFLERFSDPSQVTGKILTKAVVGLFVAVWTAELVRQSRLVPAKAALFWRHLDTGLVAYLQDRLGLPPLKGPLMALWVGFAQVKAMLAPLFTIFDVVIWCASVLLVLPLLSDEHEGPYALHALFAAGCFIEWLRIFSPIPILGSLIAGIVVPLYFVFALKWIYKTSFVNALVASELLSWTLALVGLSIVMIGAFSWSFVF
jgi:hypothetical protein